MRADAVTHRDVSEFGKVSVWALACAMCASGLFATPAYAQSQPVETDNTQSESDEGASTGAGGSIVVTGSRVRSEFTAPTPLQIIGSEQLENRAAVNAYEVLGENPAVSTRTSATASGIRFQAAGQNFVDLRTLGTARTLVLVNGRRFVPSVPTESTGVPYQVDINLIPSLMIDRVEVTTGGASAAYGSDAVAGVVNLVLKDRVDGVQLEGQVGLAEEGDAFQYRLGGVAGFDFADSRGHLVVSADYVSADPVFNMDRDHSSRYFSYFNNPLSTAANGLPQQILVTSVQAQPGNRTPGGLIVGATGGTIDQRNALIGLQFDSATSVSPFDRGLYNPAGLTQGANTTSGRFVGTQLGGSNPVGINPTLRPESERKIFYGLVDFEVTDDIELFLEGSYGRSGATFVGVPSADQVSPFNPATGTGSLVRIYADNPYIPDTIRGLIPAPAGPSSSTRPSQSFLLARTNDDQPAKASRVVDEAITASAGAKGSLGANWDWDVSYTWGRNDYIRDLFDNRNREKYALAADVIRDPTTGNIVCRSSLTDQGNGCVPINLFGFGSPTDEALAYVQDDISGLARYIQNAAQANIRGTPFGTWAGDVSVAVGVEWRHESLDSTASTTSVAYDSSVGSNFGGSFSVKEIYGEATVPLAEDMPLLESLAINGAVRHAKYSGDASAAGGQTTWKVGTTWEPFDGLLLRAVRSLDIRAPSLTELQTPNSRSVQVVNFGTQQFTNVQINTSGSLGLTPERSKTFSVGASFTPNFISGLRLSVDYFDIQVNNVITTFGPDQIASSCFRGISDFCDLLSFTGPGQTGTLVAVSNPFLNLASIETRGIDFNLAYQLPLGPGDLTLRGSAAYTDKFTITTPTDPPSVQQYAGDNSNNEFAVPSWRANASLTYDRDSWSLTLQSLFVSRGRVNTRLSEVGTPTRAPDVSVEDNRVDPYFLFNLSGTVNILDDDRAQFFWLINNMFDKEPPLIPRFGYLFQTNGGLYDVLGRSYRAGVRVKF